MTILLQNIAHTNFSDVTHNMPVRLPTHPGEYLKVEFLDELGITAYALGKATNIPASRLSEIINGKRSISADTAIRLAKYFGNTAQFWLNMQSFYDLQIVQHEISRQLEQIEPLTA